jgi:uncharacterized lipoprotein YbaY
LRFPAAGAAVDLGKVRISVRDISEADAPARTIAEVAIPQVHVPADGLDLPFSVDADLADSGRTYVVRAHADRDDTGAVTVGDLVTTAAHRVRPADARPLVIDLHPVGG